MAAESAWIHAAAAMGVVVLVIVRPVMVVVVVLLLLLVHRSQSMCREVTMAMTPGQPRSARQDVLDPVLTWVLKTSLDVLRLSALSADWADTANRRSCQRHEPGDTEDRHCQQ